jgi:predicted phosphodiesterase
MRYAIISDIHANVEALEAVIEDTERRRVDKIVCLGDIVGYNANPNETVDLIREKGIVTIGGNHDERAAGDEEPYGFNPQARSAILWTRDQITPENKEYLASLPVMLTVDDLFLMVHGSVNSVDDYILSTSEAILNFELLKKEGSLRICFFGQTHRPAIFVEDEGRVFLVRGEGKEYDFMLRDNAYYLINPGAVGQPRDHDERASYIIYDARRDRVSFYRVVYDTAAASRKIVGAGLPFTLAVRIKQGW